MSNTNQLTPAHVAALQRLVGMPTHIPGHWSPAAKGSAQDSEFLRDRINLSRAIHTMTTQGGSQLIAGPSGTGKSTYLRRGLRAYQGGIIMLAPGADELASYLEFQDRWQVVRWQPSADQRLANDRAHDDLVLPSRTDEAPYLLATFADDDYLPSLLGAKAPAYGHRRALRFLRAVAQVTEEAVLNGGPPPYPFLAMDTLTALGVMANNAMMADMKITQAPAAMSPEGNTYYSGYRSKMEELMTVIRRLRGLGMQVACTAHVTEKEVKQKELIGGVETPSVKQIMPMFTGQFRESVGASFDLVLHSFVKDKACWLRWQPSMNRQTKSRMGMLGEEGKPLANDWMVVQTACRLANAL